MESDAVFFLSKIKRGKRRHMNGHVRRKKASCSLYKCKEEGSKERDAFYVTTMDILPEVIISKYLCGLLPPDK
jgi:hypothetical protein